MEDNYDYNKKVNKKLRDEKAGEIISKIHIGLRDIIKPGITTLDIDKFLS